jgi:hypothetical protein
MHVRMAREWEWMLALPTQDAGAGSTLTRGKPHIVLAHNDYMYLYYR